MVFCLASLTFGQDAETRVFHLTNLTAMTSLQEIATILRTVGQIRQLSVDIAGRTVTLKGTADQIALAGWLVPRLEVSAGSPQAIQEYRASSDSDDVVVVFNLAQAATSQGMQEIVMAVRVVADIEKIFLLAERGIVTLRGSASQVAVSRFLIPELDQAQQPRIEPMMHEFTVPGSENTVVVYGLTHTESPVSIQELITTLRAVLDINRIFSATPPKLIIMRASPSQVQMVKWLIPELDRQAANTGENEMRMPGGNDDVVHVFYLSHATTPERMNRLMTEIRRSAFIQKAFMRTEPPALVARHGGPDGGGGPNNRVGRSRGALSGAHSEIATSPRSRVSPSGTAQTPSDAPTTQFPIFPFTDSNRSCHLEKAIRRLSIWYREKRWYFKRLQYIVAPMAACTICLDLLFRMRSTGRGHTIPYTTRRREPEQRCFSA